MDQIQNFSFDELLVVIWGAACGLTQDWVPIDCHVVERIIHSYHIISCSIVLQSLEKIYIYQIS